jgi:hypothetical protein
MLEGDKLSTCEPKRVTPLMLIRRQNDQKKRLQKKRNQGCKCHQPKRGKNKKEKCLKNNTKHENGQKQKGPNEWITLVHTNKQKEDKQISQKGMMG